MSLRFRFIGNSTFSPFAPHVPIKYWTEVNCLMIEVYASRINYHYVLEIRFSTSFHSPVSSQSPEITFFENFVFSFFHFILSTSLSIYFNIVHFLLIRNWSNFLTRKPSFPFFSCLGWETNLFNELSMLVLLCICI